MNSHRFLANSAFFRCTEIFTPGNIAKNEPHLEKGCQNRKVRSYSPSGSLGVVVTDGEPVPAAGGWLAGTGGERDGTADRAVSSRPSRSSSASDESPTRKNRKIPVGEQIQSSRDIPGHNGMNRSPARSASASRSSHTSEQRRWRTRLIRTWARQPGIKIERWQIMPGPCRYSWTCPRFFAISSARSSARLRYRPRVTGDPLRRRSVCCDSYQMAFRIFPGRLYSPAVEHQGTYTL